MSPRRLEPAGVPARRPRHRAPQPAAADRRPGPGVLPLRDPAGPPLLPPGRRRRGVPRPGRLAVGARDRDPAPAWADRRRPGPSPGGQPDLLGRLGRPHPARQDGHRAPDRLLRPARRGWSTSASRPSASAWSPAGTTARCVGECWNGSPYQPVPVARDVRQKVALRILEQPEDYPAVLAEQQSVRAYPRPYGVNLRPRAGLSQPDHPGRAVDGPRRTATSPSTAPPRSAAPAWSRSTTRWLRGMPGYRRSRWTRWAACWATTPRWPPSPATPWSPRSTPRCRGWWSSSSPRRSRPPARPTTRSPTATTSPTPAPWS